MISNTEIQCKTYGRASLVFNPITKYIFGILLTVKNRSITLLSRRVSRQDSVGFNITFWDDSNIAI